MYFLHQKYLLCTGYSLKVQSVKNAELKEHNWTMFVQLAFQKLQAHSLMLIKMCFNYQHVHDSFYYLHNDVT